MNNEYMGVVCVCVCVFFFKVFTGSIIHIYIFFNVWGPLNLPT